MRGSVKRPRTTRLHNARSAVHAAGNVISTHVSEHPVFRTLFKKTRQPRHSDHQPIPLGPLEVELHSDGLPQGSRLNSTFTVQHSTLGNGSATSGDHSTVEPPGPIPNPEVKRCCADGSGAIGPVRVGRRQVYARHPLHRGCRAFSCPGVNPYATLAQPRSQDTPQQVTLNAALHGPTDKHIFRD